MTTSPKPLKQEQERASDEITEVAPGVLRLQLPVELPGLGHVNCYALEDERGVALIDPGLPGPDSWKALVERLGQAGFRVSDVHTAVITHSHFDHFGGAQQLRDEAGADILTHDDFRALWERNEAGEIPDSDVLETNDEDEIERRIEQMFSRRTPWGTVRQRPPDHELERMRSEGRFSLRWFRTPEPSIRVNDSQVIRLARREWLAVHTPGHTGDHLCLFDPEHGAMISGDHVLPTITPHIGGISPQDDPLACFFDSLERMKTFEGVNVALPAHGHPFTDLAGRADEIIEHHQHRLEVITTAAHEMGEGT
ncbi:MAG: MBL fold metallo-hydrolase, partial [Acidimicrobiales bacterium]|nr:MBL fold metallo-hydrolase [Acidimicrobiales bacterium]